MTVTIEAIKTFKKYCEHYNAPKFSGGIIMEKIPHLEKKNYSGKKK